MSGGSDGGADGRREAVYRRLRTVSPKLPIAHWLPGYERRWLRPDLIAAVAVWAILVPEGMAYASLAGMPPETGLYAALAPLVLYAALGTCRQLTVGPSSAIAAFSAAIVAPLALGDGGRFIALSALLAILAGGVLLAAGVARLGFIADFFARPVLIGFVAGLALVIAVGQANKLLGVEGGGETFFGKVAHLLGELGDASLTTLAVGVAALLVIFALRAWLPKAPSALIAVVLGVAATAVLQLDQHGVAIVGEVPSGLPTLTIPSFGISDVTQLLPDALALALVAFAESVAGARAFAEKHGYEVDADQELVALGASNVGAGLLQGFAVDASLSRSAVADDAGARSQVSGLILFGFVIVTMLFLTPLFHDLPEAVLGAIVIAAVAHLVDVPALRRLLPVDRLDFAIAVVCFVGVLVFGIVVGLFVAVAASLLALVYRAYRPSSAVLGLAPGDDSDELFHYRDIAGHPEYATIPGLIILRFDNELFFANSAWFCEKVWSLVREHPGPVREVLVQAGAISHVDTTAATALDKLVTDLGAERIDLAFARVTGPLRRALERNGIVDLVDGRVFVSMRDAVLDFNERRPEGR